MSDHSCLADHYFPTWVEGFRVPAVLITLDLQLIWTNPAADVLFSSSRDFQVLNGALICGDKIRSQEFRKFLAGLGDVPDAWIFQGETANQIVRAEAVKPAGLAPGAALMIYPAAHFYWSNFDRPYGLTPAETAVVKRIVSGESAQTIAFELSVTLETVRTHVRRAYAKLGINNREQLFALLCQFRVR